MTIRRQYSLPNCTLVLEGLSDGSTTSQLDIRPVLSILMSAECYFTSLASPLTGGRDFFESLVRAVSSYAQEFMSGVHYPDRHDYDSPIVHLHKIDANLHRLTVLSAVAGSETQIDEKTQLSAEVDLTTVQLFDLVEAIDQFFADTQTLPGLSLQLTPVSKRYIKSAEPVTQRALPAIVGVSSLALAAMAFFLVPIPEVQRPKDPIPQPNATSQNLGTPTPSGSGSPNPTPTPPADGLLPGDRTPLAEIASPTPIPTAIPTETPTATPTATPTDTPTETPDVSSSVSPSPLSEGLQNSEATVAPITDPAEIEQLRGKLSDQIEGVLRNQPSIYGGLVYRVSVAKDGAIVGYKSENSATVDKVGDTLFSELLFKPIGTRPSPEPLADFRVVFAPSGNVQVTPW
jgi:Domain of unknown function (DUF4335)